MGVVLIAFERESEQSTLEQLLTGRGHRVMKAGNGLIALDTARREPPDIVVSDIVLPRMDGFALCRKWKQDERLRSVPFIFYTRRHDDPKYERFALELGAERFLARSVQPDALLNAVDQLLAAAPARNATTPLPALDEAAFTRAQAFEKAQQTQALALERSQQAQSQLREQIAELETTNQRLAAGEARFRQLFEANPLPMWIADRATDGFIAVNDAALALHGYTRAEFLMLKAEDLAVSADRSAPLVVQKRKDGSNFPASVTLSEIDFDGRSAYLASAHDLTERLSAERDLREQLTASRTLFDAAADGAWILDAESRIVDVNAAYCSMSGYQRAALLHTNAKELDEQSAGEITVRLRLGRLSGGGHYESKHKRADGTTMDVEVSSSALENGRGETLVLIRDVSQRRRELVAQRQRQRQSEFLVELFRQAENFDEAGIVRRVLEQAAELIASPLAFLYFVDPTAKTLNLVGWRDRAQNQTAFPNAQPRALNRAGLLADVVRSKQASTNNDPTQKPQEDGLPDLQRVLLVPMVAEEQTIAVLGVANREAIYADEDQRALLGLADVVWRVLQSKRAHARTLGALQRTDVALQGMIDAFVRISEHHDPYTAGSSRRLAALAVAIARESGLDGERQHALRVAALLHDVGNIAVPASILAKPAPLTETEHALMRSHVEEGCQLLADIDFGAPVADIVFQTHERCDGSGYPRGLKGDEIMLEARILAIADTVEAMCSPRPYRPAAGLDAAIEEINRGAGTRYDEQLVDACTTLIQQKGFRLPE
jgi:PAS domain S-box-containing protein